MGYGIISHLAWLATNNLETGQVYHAPTYLTHTPYNIEYYNNDRNNND